MAKRRQPRSTDPPRPAGPSRVAGHRAKIWLATISTVVGVATGMFTLRDQVFPSEAGSAGAMSTPAYEEHVGRVCDEVNANDRLRAHEDSILRVGLPRAQTTIDQRNLLLDAARRTIARDGHALAAFTGLAAPDALAPVRHDTGTAWNRNLARVRDYALRLDGAGTRAQLVAALVHLSTVRPQIAADHVTVASGLERLGAAECDLQPQRVTRTFTLPPPRAQNKPGIHGTGGHLSRDTPALGHRRGTAARADPAGAGAATVPAVDGTQPTGREHADAERASTDARPEQREHARSRRRRGRRGRFRRLGQQRQRVDRARVLVHLRRERAGHRRRVVVLDDVAPVDEAGGARRRGRRR